MAKRISTDELQKHINTLSMSEVLTILDTYSKANGEDVAAARNRLITDDLQARLEANNINVVNFDKREYLLDLPKYKIKDLCAKYNIPQRWARYSKVSALLKQANIWEDILLLMSEDKKNKIDKEDLQYIADQQYVIEAQEKKKAKKSAP